MNTWKYEFKFEWMRKLFIEEGFLLIWKLKHFFFEIRKSAAFYKVIRTSSFMPIHMKSCNAFMKRYHLKMFKNQKKSCTGSLGTGSDTDRTRFLVNVISQISKISRRNRFPYWYNPVPGTNSRDMFFNKFWNPVPC